MTHLGTSSDDWPARDNPLRENPESQSPSGAGPDRPISGEKEGHSDKWLLKLGDRLAKRKQSTDPNVAASLGEMNGG